MINISYSLDEVIKKLEKRNEGDQQEQIGAVKQIVAEVASKGDAALFEYTKRFDGFDVDEKTLVVSEKEIEQAYKNTAPELIEIVQKSAQNIRAFHTLQKREDFMAEFNGRMLGQRILPIAGAGVYVPGGKASYPSSVLMNIIPAKVAEVPYIAVATPADREGKIPDLTLVAAREAGADIIYKMGGAQAIAALAYGTKCVRKVDKITGPGNIYVALAKKEVFGKVGIDMIAGPSEVLVIADESAHPKFVAADFLSQAEHDELAACILITTSQGIAEQTQAEIQRQAEALPKKEIVYKSLKNYGTILIAKDLEEAAKMSDAIAPEHLELCVDKPQKLLSLIKNAGSIFVGHYTPEPLGDYYAGPNHVLPTNGTARFSSPLSVDDFIKKSSVLHYSKQAFEQVYKDVQKFAEAEGLVAHARSAQIRFEEI